MRNPFTVPLRSGEAGRELGHPAEGFDFPKPHTQPDIEGNYPDFPSGDNTPFPYHGTVGERFQQANPAYAGEYHPAFLDAPGAVSDFTQLAPAPGSENLTAPRNANSKPGTNRLFHPGGPVTGAPASPGWSGHITPLHKPNVGNSGPVSGGRDSAQVAAQAYWASQAAQLSQRYSDAALVSAL